MVKKHRHLFSNSRKQFSFRCVELLTYEANATRICNRKIQILNEIEVEERKILKKKNDGICHSNEIKGDNKIENNSTQIKGTATDINLNQNKGITQHSFFFSSETGSNGGL